MHPFLQTDFHIRWSELKPEHIVPDISKALDEAKTAVDAVAAQSAPLTYENTLMALDEGLETLSRAWGLVNHLDAVCNSPELREAYNTMLPQVVAFFSGIPLNDALWSVLKAYGESDAVAELSPTKQRYVQETLADFREAGADLPPEQKKRAAELLSRIAEITQKYSENCLDAVNAWEKLVTDESLLSGLPDSAIAAAKEDAERKGHENTWRFTLQAPSYIPVMTYAESDELRKEVWQAFAAIGRHAPHDNRALVREILDLRHEFARLVGDANFADHVTARRMASSGKSALQFTESIFEKVRNQFETEAEQLRSFKANSSNGNQRPATESEQPPPLLEPWEAAYWAEKQRKAHYDFDEEELRPYFPINRVIPGLFELAQQIFGLRIEPAGELRTSDAQDSAPEAPQCWHEDVQFYDLFDADTDEHLGSFYADWHPRESKRGGAWMNSLLTGNRDPKRGERSPHLGLICGNLTPSVGGKPALLTHREVETIFHEFGHLLHHLCGEVEVKALNGVNVPWDFVELPSQIMENWCWERESLDRFARHHETGDPIPQALFEKMLAARNYMKASANVRQLSFGKMDLELHINWPLSEKADLDDFINNVLQGYTAEYATRPKSNVFNFSHLFSSPTGYAAGYYSYKWAEVLDADAFTRFQIEGLLNPQTGRDFRRKILSKGNSEDPAKLYKDFMGRAPDPDALLRRDDLL
ncbi:MAG: M3 family metallopeptidase [Opitutales bacterium]